MAGATAATAAGVTASQANTVTVNLLNNYISAFGGIHLNADLTGDGSPDLTIFPATAFHSSHKFCSTCTTIVVNARARVVLNGVYASAWAYGDGRAIGERLGSKTASVRYGGGPATLMGSIPITFKDLHINGGALTEGSLEVTVSSGGPEIQLDSFTYNEVPEGSTLALLAIGASGILVFRRSRTAKGRP